MICDKCQSKMFVVSTMNLSPNKGAIKTTFDRIWRCAQCGNEKEASK